jgi:DNA-binding beta-propeller fold protein YncE
MTAARAVPLVAILGLMLTGAPAIAAGSGYHVVARIAGPDGGWDYASYDRARDRVLVARTDAITAIDLKTGAVNPAFAKAARGHAAFTVNGGAEVAITNGTSNTVAFVDADTGAPVAEVATGDGPDDAILDPTSGLLLVMNHRGGDVTLVDPKAHKAVGTISVGGTLEAAAVDGKGRAFVNVEDKNQIAVIDIAARKVVARYALAGCEGPTGIAYAAADKLLISSCDGVAEVVASDTGKVVRQIKIGGGADGVAYDPGRKLAFIPAGRDGTLSVIAVAHGDAALVETVATQKGARTLALDPGAGRIFLPTARYVAPAGGGRPTATPGTFQVLVIGK